MKLSTDDIYKIKRRLLAYSPNLKQSWMMHITILGFYLIALLIVSLIGMLTGISAKLAPEWKDLTGHLLSVVIAVVIVIRLGKDSNYVPIVLPRQSLLLWLLLVPFVLSVSITAELLTMWIPRPYMFINYMDYIDRQFQNNLPAFLSMLVAPVFSEWLSRGIVLKGLLTHYSPLKAIMWSSVIFGVLHAEPRMIVFAFFIGLAIGWIYWRTRSLCCCILMQVTINMFTFLVKFYIPGKTTFADLIGSYFIAVAIALFVCALTVILIKKIVVSYDITSDMQSS